MTPDDKLQPDEIVHGAPRKRSWGHKFRDSFRGIRLAISGQSSFIVHFVVAAFVCGAALLLRCSRTEWCILLLCIGFVLCAEILNSSIEGMARAVDRDYNESLGRALDMASGAVLVASFAAAIVGIVVFLGRLGQLLHWWT